MRERNRYHRSYCIAATFVAAIACAVPAKGEDAPLTPLGPQTTEQPAAVVDRYTTAAEAFRAAKWSTAADEFRLFITEQTGDPRVEQARFFLAESLLRDGKYPPAAVAFRAVLKTATDEATIAATRYRLGEALYLSRSYAAAITALSEFLDLHPIHAAAPRAWHYLTESAYAVGDFERAETAAAYLTACYPDDDAASRVALLQAAALLQLGRTREARTVLIPLAADAGAQRDPAIDVLLGSLQVAAADEALAAGDAAEAEAILNRFAAEHPRHELAPYAAYRLAELAAAAGEWETAAKRFAAALERGDLDDNLTPQAWLARVQALAQDRDWAEVLMVAATAQQQLRDWPRRYEFDYLRGRAHIARAEMNEARTAFGRVLTSTDAAGTETAALAQYMTAETHFLQRHYDTALTEYRRAVEHKHPHWQAAAQLQAGKCCEQLHRPAEACASYDVLLRDFADSAFAAEARTRREACLKQASAPAAAQRK